MVKKVALREDFKKVITLDAGYGYLKYRLLDDYEGYNIYEEISTKGYPVHNSWVLESEDYKDIIVIRPFNNVSKKDLYNMIDEFYSFGKFDIKVFDRSNEDDFIYVMHNNGDIEI